MYRPLEHVRQAHDLPTASPHGVIPHSLEKTSTIKVVTSQPPTGFSACKQSKRLLS